MEDLACPSARHIQKDDIQTLTTPPPQSRSYPDQAEPQEMAISEFPSAVPMGRSFTFLDPAWAFFQGTVTHWQDIPRESFISLLITYIYNCRKGSLKATQREKSKSRLVRWNANALKVCIQVAIKRLFYRCREACNNSVFSVLGCHK